MRKKLERVNALLLIGELVKLASQLATPGGNLHLPVNIN